MSEEVARRRYRELQRYGRRRGRRTDEQLILYALEGFLRRLVSSPHADAFVLKGGVLMAAMGVRRPTVDIDMQGRGVPVDETHLSKLVAEVSAINVGDGLVYDTSTIIATTIRDGDSYSGVRIQLDAALSTGRMQLKLDISTGDPVVPEPGEVEVPSLIEDVEPIRMAGYPLAAVLAEKLVTALQRGTANTRWRDFADVHLLLDAHDVDPTDLDAAIMAVADYRGIPLRPLAPELDGFADANQPRWVAWRAKQNLTDLLPEDFSVPVNTCIAVFDAAVARISPDE